MISFILILRTFINLNSWLSSFNFDLKILLSFPIRQIVSSFEGTIFKSNNMISSINLFSQWWI